MGFGLLVLWVMGYEGIMGYGPNFPTNQVGNLKKLWVIREYGLWELWVRRELTVLPQIMFVFYATNCAMIAVICTIKLACYVTGT